MLAMPCVVNAWSPSDSGGIAEAAVAARRGTSVLLSTAIDQAVLDRLCYVNADRVRMAAAAIASRSGKSANPSFENANAKLARLRLLSKDDRIGIEADEIAAISGKSFQSRKATDHEEFAIFRGPNCRMVGSADAAIA